MEFTTVTNGTIQSTTVRSGTYAGQITSLVSATARGFLHQFASAAAGGPYYFRFYFRYATAPSADNCIFSLDNDTTIAEASGPAILLTSAGELKLMNGASQVGSTSSALSANTWYRIEVQYDGSPASGSEVLRARIDGTEFAGASNLTLATATIHSVAFGGNIRSEAQTTGNWYFDDIAINDSTGSFQTSYPGEGEIILLRPNNTGDNNQLGTASSTNYQNVDEVTPDDATTEINMTADTAGEVDDYNLSATPSALASTDIINVVQVGLRFRGGGSTDPIVVGIKASASGTVEESGNITASNSSYATNAAAAPFNYPLTLYDLPGASTTVWTKTDLDAAQVRVKLPTAAQPFKPRFSAVWVLVDHKPNYPPTITPNTADATDFGADTTPTLEFTGSDTESNDLQYNVQISTDNDFVSIDGYDYSNRDTQFILGTGNRRIGQSFTGNGSVIANATFLLKIASGSPAGNITVSIYAHSGTFGTSSVGTGSALATSDPVSASVLTSSFTPLAFSFSGGNQITLTSGTRYVAAVEYYDGTTSLNVGVDQTSSSHSGNTSFYDGATWDFDNAYDLPFSIATTGFAILDKVSGTDSGFANTVTGGDTDPFNAGEKVSFTVQAGDALAFGTYYWRARAIDPSGSNTYSSWTTTRSFTVTSAGASLRTRHLSLLGVG